MATLALAVAGAAAGSALLPAGVTILGATLTGATIGAQIGALAGSVVDRALFGASGQSRALQGPRLTELRVTGSSEGAPIPRLYGRARLGGQLIWATDFEEEVVTTSHGGGGKGGVLGPNPSPQSTAITPASPSPCARARSPASAASGPTAPSSTSPPSPTASTPAARFRSRTP
jgi:hypothetical protein